jgi:hypothetical protein
MSNSRIVRRVAMGVVGLLALLAIGTVGVRWYGAARVAARVIRADGPPLSIEDADAPRDYIRGHILARPPWTRLSGEWVAGAARSAVARAKRKDVHLFLALVEEAARDPATWEPLVTEVVSQVNMRSRGAGALLEMRLRLRQPRLESLALDRIAEDGEPELIVSVLISYERGDLQRYPSALRVMAGRRDLPDRTLARVREYLQDSGDEHETGAQSGTRPMGR